jgi:hypothetical protein
MEITSGWRARALRYRHRHIHTYTHTHTYIRTTYRDPDLPLRSHSACGGEASKASFYPSRPPTSSSNSRKKGSPGAYLFNCLSPVCIIISAGCVLIARCSLSRSGRKHKLSSSCIGTVDFRPHPTPSRSKFDGNTALLFTFPAGPNQAWKRTNSLPPILSPHTFHFSPLSKIIVHPYIHFSTHSLAVLRCQCRICVEQLSSFAVA